MPPLIPIREKDSMKMLTELRTTARRLGAGTIQKIRLRPAVALGALAATGVLSAGLAGAPLAQASVTSALPGVIGHHVEASGASPAVAAHVRSYWTRDRMLSARNADVLTVKPGRAARPRA